MRPWYDINGYSQYTTGKLEAAADHQLAELEAGRDISQSIVHVDMDAFFAVGVVTDMSRPSHNAIFVQSVEELDNPELKGKAYAVISVFTHHMTLLICYQVGGGGILSTSSYEARKYGVRSGMASSSFSTLSISMLSNDAAFIAKQLCPDLIMVKSHYDRYNEMSELVMDVFSRYDPNMCAAGCDEAYLK